MGIIRWIKDYFKETGDLNKKRFKKLVLSAHFWVILIALGLIIFGISRAAFLTYQRTDRNIAAVWQQGGTMGYRHVSVFAGGDTSPIQYKDADSSLKRSDIILIRKALQNTVDSGNPAKRKNEDPNGRPVGWEDCFSTTLKGYISRPAQNGSNSVPVGTDAELIATEGNFKVFHPFKYLSGGYLPETQVDANQVVINDVLAWKFFNSYDVVGYKVEMFGEQFTICGVVSEPSDSLARTCGTYEPRAYMYFQKLEKIYSLQSSPEEEGVLGNYEVAIQVYEALLPEAVTGVAKSDITNALPSYKASDPKMYIVSNTGRYNILSVWDFCVPLGEMGEKLSAYEFPYWEKTAQLTMQHLFADAVVIASGTVLLGVGIIMAILRYRKNIPDKKKTNE